MRKKEGYFILDLDQTLISAEPTEEYDFKKNKDKAKKFIFHNMDDYYIVFERPGVQDFLTYLFDNFNVSVWTAASKDYALFVIDKVLIAGNNNRKLDFIFFDYHCDVSKKLKKGSKDLNLLWDTFNLPIDKNNTVILDDNPEVQKNNKKCIKCKPFEFTDTDSEKDTFLTELVSKLRQAETLKELL